MSPPGSGTCPVLLGGCRRPPRASLRGKFHASESHGGAVGPAASRRAARAGIFRNLAVITVPCCAGSAVGLLPGIP
jgi:hypothetical protein